MAKLVQKNILKHDLKLKALIQDIRDCETSADELCQLHNSAREECRLIKSLIDEMECLALQQDKEKDKQGLLVEADRWRKLFAINQADMRKAFLDSSKIINKNQRQSLLSSAPDGLRQRSTLQKDMVLRNSTNATESLLQISRMLAEQVDSSTNTLNTLQDTSSTLQETQMEVSGMANVIKASGKLLTKYGRRELTDRVLILLATMFFFACVLYVIKKRLPMPLSFLGL